MPDTPGVNPEVTRPSWTAAEAAALLEAKVVGDGAASFETLESLDRAGPNALTFIRDAQYARQWQDSRASAVLVSRPVYEDPRVHLEPGEGRAILVVDDADLAMLHLLEAAAQVLQRVPEPGIHPTASVDPSATIGAGVFIGPYASVGPGSTVGDRTRLHAGVRLGAGVRVGIDCDLRSNAVVEDRCTLGDRVVFYPGVVIGADGFGYRPSSDGRGILKIPHIGAVRIGSDVEIGANTCIDRGKFSDTVIGDGTKIDNLVQVGHNVRIGRSCIVCGNTGIAGSAVIGDGVTIGGDCSIHDNITIGDGATLAARSGVMTDVPQGSVWGGNPAGPVKEFLRQMASMRYLPDAVRDYKKRAKRQDDQGSSAT